MRAVKMKTRIWENQNTLVYEGDTPKEIAIKMAIRHHLAKPDRYHEIYRLDPDMGWIGVAQWKPGDCEHYRPKENCPYCKVGVREGGQKDE